jgi:glycosyltransferase involved in cell wall biosynthesis
MRVRIYSSLDFAEWQRAGLAGRRPGLAPYGLEHLAQAGLSLVPRQPPPWLAGRRRSRIVSSVEWRLLPLVGPLQLLHAHDDMAMAVLEREGLTHALLKRAGLAPWSRVPLVLVSCWMADEVRNASRARMRVLRLLAGSADLIVFWSENQRSIFRDRLGVPASRLFCVPFGIETDFYAPVDAPREPFVLSVGRDRGRDWRTLVDGVNLVEAPVKLVCPPAAVRGLRLADHVEMLGQLDHVHLRELLSRASVVALALDPDVAYPTGQTVLLNAMAVGTPTVITASAPMSDYAHHDVNSWVVRARDPRALRDGIMGLLSDPEAARRIRARALRDVRDRFNAATMWRAVAERMKALEAGRR